MNAGLAGRGVNPRLIDYFRLNFNQDDVDFAIPHLQEDISLYLDPFLLWKSESEQYQRLHSQLLVFFEHLREQILAGRRTQAMQILMECRETPEIGLGYSLGSKRGSSIGPGLANRILDVYEEIPQIQETGLNHIEVLGLVVPKLAEDRISDLTAAILKGFFVAFSEDRARTHAIPTKRFQLDSIYDFERRLWKPLTCDLPFNPLDDTPLLLAPLNLLRHLPWINYADYYRSRFAHLVLPAGYRGKKLTKEQVLALNRKSYVAVERYVADREDTAAACRPAPLFEPLKLETLLKKYSQLRKLPTGKTDGSDKRYEQLAYELLSSLLYPELEFAEDQVRTVSGVHIRDIIFYNDGKSEFLREMKDLHDARQPVFELKNVSSLDGGHVNQLYRYLDPVFGRFGVLVNRLPLPKSVWKNVIDLHSSKRAVILALDDSDLDLMISMLASGRRPIDVIKKRYIEFTRLLPK
jgi:hypothetical protein